MDHTAFPDHPLVLIGGGGHGRVLSDLVDALGWSLLAVADPTPDLVLGAFPGAEHWRSDAQIFDHAPATLALINGVGAIPGAATRRRRALYIPFIAAGFSFPSLVHPGAIVSKRVKIAQAVQIMAGAVIQSGCSLGFGVVINTRASIDHDCQIAAHAMISPGAVLCGGVTVGEGAYLGAGCVIAQGITIGANALIGLGARVTADVPDGARVVA